MAGTEESVKGLSQEQINDIESLHQRLVDAGCAIKFEELVIMVVNLLELGFDENVAQSLILSENFISWDDLREAQYGFDDYRLIPDISVEQARHLFEKVNPGMRVRIAPTKKVTEKKDDGVIAGNLATA